MKIRQRRGKNASRSYEARRRSPGAASSLPEVLLSGLIILGCVAATALAADAGSRMLQAARQRFSGLSYPEDSEMGVFFALAVPLDDPVSTKSISVAFFFEANYKLPNNPDEFQDGEKEGKEEEVRRRDERSIDRKTVYAMLESKFESLGFPGRQCLLRSICETATGDWRQGLQHNGLVGDLMRITFTPSSSSDEGLAVEYSQAERRMDLELADCGSIYHLCPFSIYQYITDVLE